MTEIAFGDIAFQMRRADQAAQLSDIDVSNIPKSIHDFFHLKALSQPQLDAVREAAADIAAYLQTRTFDRKSVAPPDDRLREKAWDALSRLEEIAAASPANAIGRALGL